MVGHLHYNFPILSRYIEQLSLHDKFAVLGMECRASALLSKSFAEPNPQPFIFLRRAYTQLCRQGLNLGPPASAS